MELKTNITNISLNTSLITSGNKSLEDYDVSIKVLFGVIGVPFMLFSTIALVALNRTRQTPQTARFLSSGLITYDILAVGCFTVRKVVEDHGLNIFIQVVGTGFSFLAYITVGVMSLERLVIFYSPHFYLRHMNPSRVKKCVYVVWIAIFITYYFVRFGACYIKNNDFTMYDVIGMCNQASFLYYGVFIIGVVIISIACYVKIFLIVRSEKQHANKSESLSATARRLQDYKSTSLVFVYILTIIITSVAYGFIITLNLDTVPLRLANDVVNTFNCMMDPCMYILWYSECRMEILKLMTVCTPSLSTRIEQMRIKIFDIVTVENVHQFRSNQVHPSQPDRF